MQKKTVKARTYCKTSELFEANNKTLESFNYQTDDPNSSSVTLDKVYRLL